MLKHSDVWRAIDRLAEKNGLSPSGLAKKAGLSPTLFNPSKRSNGKRKRWPSTESVAMILQATGASLDDFVALAEEGEGAVRNKIPLISMQDASKNGVFDENGNPCGKMWDETVGLVLSDVRAFALEVRGKQAEPVYRDGDRLILSPSEKLRRGDRVVLRMKSGEILIGQINREGAQKIELSPMNPESPPATLLRRDMDWIYRVVWAGQ